MGDSLPSAILTFTPVYKPYVWGGTSLPLKLGRTDAPPLERYAESWELSDHSDGMSVAKAGLFAGLSLRELVRTHGRLLTGGEDNRFPLLIKILDAAERLSVQVHPDDESAARHGGEPKTECWYILDAAPGASVWAGLLPGVTPDRFRSALENGNVADLLRRVPVAQGDLLFIPGGRVHAIGEGCLILEVQQSSNTTYRVFDWNRSGTDGKPRELHVEKALETIRWDDTGSPLAIPGPAIREGLNTRTERLACPYFQLEELTLRVPLDVRHEGASFHALHLVSGALGVEPLDPGHPGEKAIPAGTTVLLPAAMHGYRLSPSAAGSTVIRITIPRRA